MRRIDLDIAVEPEAGTLNATAVLSVSGDADSSRARIELFLNRSFTVEAAEVDGVPSGFQWGAEDRTIPYVEAAHPLIVHVPRDVENPSRVELRYRGDVREQIADVNVIAPDRVELASYAAYFPRPFEVYPFTFRLQITAPSNFTIVARGTRVDRKVSDGRVVETWRTDVPGVDVPIFASSEIAVQTADIRGTDVSVYYRKLPSALARDALDEAIATLGYLNDQFGATEADALRVIFSPRGGWGYSRSGWFIVSEQRHLALTAGSLAADDQRPADAGAHGNAHEISHFWWRIAEPTTQNDWLNEALAEFSAAKDSQRRGGDSLLMNWARQYSDSVAEAAPAIGILATSSSDKHRYVKWYERGALFFLCTERLIGEATLNAALRSLLALGRRRRVTTEDVLDELTHAGVPEAWLDEWLRGTKVAPLEACVASL